jgi:hypothetical protein
VCRTACRLRHVRADCRQTGPPPGSGHCRDGPEQPRVDGYRWHGCVKYRKVIPVCPLGTSMHPPTGAAPPPAAARRIDGQAQAAS